MLVSLLYSLAVLLFFIPGFVNALPFVPRQTSGSLTYFSGMFGKIEAFLEAHNAVRARHNATNLEWSFSLAEKAQLWADQCKFKHSDGVLSTEPYGENIAAATGSFPISSAVGTFVADESKYDSNSPSFLRFTQVVWKSTTELGCALSQCDGIFDKSFGKASLYVCLYNPAGNVIGELTENVQVLNL